MLDYHSISLVSHQFICHNNSWWMLTVRTVGWNRKCAPFRQCECWYQCESFSSCPGCTQGVFFVPRKHTRRFLRFLLVTVLSRSKNQRLSTLYNTIEQESSTCFERCVDTLECFGFLFWWQPMHNCSKHYQIKFFITCFYRWWSISLTAGPL